MQAEPFLSSSAASRQNSGACFQRNLKVAPWPHLGRPPGERSAVPLQVREGQRRPANTQGKAAKTIQSSQRFFPRSSRNFFIPAAPSGQPRLKPSKARRRPRQDDFLNLTAPMKRFFAHFHDALHSRCLLRRGRPRIRPEPNLRRWRFPASRAVPKPPISMTSFSYTVTGGWR